MPPTKRTIALHLHIGYLFVGLLFCFAVVSSLFHYRETSRLLTEQADRNMALVGERAAMEMTQLYQPSATFVDLLSQHQIMRATTLEERLDSLSFMVDGMRRMTGLTASYVGYDNGDFFMVRRWNDEPALRKTFHAPPGTAWIVQSISYFGSTPVAQYLYYDNTLAFLYRENRDDFRFDPRSRGWFISARTSDVLEVSSPYIFFSTREGGITISRRSSNGLAVMGADIRLDVLGSVLRQSRITPGAVLALADREGNVFAQDRGVPGHRVLSDGRLLPPVLSELGVPVLSALFDLGLHERAGSQLLTRAGEEWQGAWRQITLSVGRPMILLVVVPRSELLEAAIRIRNRGLLISLAMLLAGVVMAMGLARLASRPLNALVGEAEKIRRFEFAEPIRIASHVSEVNDLALSMDSMKTTIRDFLALSSALAGESQFAPLLKRILTVMQGVSRASGGIVYLSGEEETLEPVLALWQDNYLEAPAAMQALHPGTGVAHPVLQALQHERGLPVSSGAWTQHFAGVFGRSPAPMTLLPLPLHDRKGVRLGVVALLIDAAQQPLTTELLGFTRALSGTAAVALHAQRMVKEQKDLLESFIRLIAGAIDAKSPYTGGHCNRVPELTKQLAAAACAEKHGVFADFDLDEEGWEALHIAAWLHDCGKVTTPEYVVDKSTKLETLHDRIHEIRLRFELLKRDAELASLQAMLDGEDPAAARAVCRQQCAVLDEDFAFLASCNQGGEFMDDAQRARLATIGARQWRRTLSDRIGLGHHEALRKARNGPEVLPAMEPLLADKPEHLIEREGDGHGLDDPRWQFRMTMPAHAYNRGELYNLGVSRGTLSAEERYKINEHIMQTIVMLGNLPWPRHLRHIPEIAGGHHEKMDGSGYPRGLRREEMSWPARMMAIADIFEALTASDRPYKKAKPLSEALAIMARMKDEQHIDPDLFDLFLRSGLYLDYAWRYLRPDQIDAVEVSVYLDPDRSAVRA